MSVEQKRAFDNYAFHNSGFNGTFMEYVGFTLHIARLGFSMHSQQIGKGLFLIDLQTAGYPGLFASYVLRGSKSAIIDPGPASSVSYPCRLLRFLIHGLQPHSGFSHILPEQSISGV
jgi:hypothetical protein